MDIDTIRRLVEQGNYLIKGHALQHAYKEGFGEQHMLEAIRSGTIIEEYPNESRALLCGRATLEPDVVVYLHVVCEQVYPTQVDLVTAYIPDETEWEKPPFRRRKRLRRR